MPVIYIVRHGQCECQDKDILVGQMDFPLTELGRKQAMAAGERLVSRTFAAIYSSDSSRTYNTAKAIAVHNRLPVIKTPLLRECSLGDVQGLTELEFKKRYPDEFKAWKQDGVANRPPGAETFQDVIKRCGIFLEDVRERYRSKDEIAVACHVGSVSGLICAAFDLPVSFYLSIHAENASITVLEYGECARLRLFNDTCHCDLICV